MPTSLSPPGTRGPGKWTHFSEPDSSRVNMGENSHLTGCATKEASVGLHETRSHSRMLLRT